MAGKLYVIGVGPGDPELLTLKAVRILRAVPVIFVPKGREDGTRLSLSIARKAVSLDDKEIIELHFPMKKTTHGSEMDELNSKWNEAAGAVLTRLNTGVEAAFVTLGDPSIYSTFFYLYKRLAEQSPDLQIEIVPGISSINAAAARAGVSLVLGNERIAILPANYLDSLAEMLQKFDSVVLMKVNTVFAVVRDTLVKMHLAQHSIYIARTGMKDERVIKDITHVCEEDLSYFSLILVRKG